MQGEALVILRDFVVNRVAAFNALSVNRVILAVRGQRDRFQMAEEIAVRVLNRDNDRFSCCGVCNRERKTRFVHLIIRKLHSLRLIACGLDFQRVLADVQQVLFQRDGVTVNGVILLAKLAPVAVQVERGNLAEVTLAVCEGQNNVLPLPVLRNSRCDVIELAGRGAVLNVAEQAVLKDCLGGVRREYAASWLDWKSA